MTTMKYIIVNISDITYRTQVNVPSLPNKFENVCLEFQRMDKVSDYVMRNAVGMFIMNETGFTPKDFKIDVVKHIK